MKPIGSEKIQNPDEKLKRILEIAGIKHDNVIKENTNPLSNILHEVVAANGEEYAIVQEEKHIYIKKKINEEYEYISGVENIKEFSYKTYSDALKNLNIIFKSINENTGHDDNIDMFKKKV